MPSPHLILFDASGIAWRSYHANFPRFRESDGLPTSVILGFASILWRMIGASEVDKPTLGGCVFDPPGKNFRHELFSDYKANRGPKPEELLVQLPYLSHVAETLGVTPIEHAGFEADDTIATLAHRAKKAGIRTTIVSADKDFLQCVEDGIVEVVIPRQGRMLKADVIKRWGVEPEQFRDFQALCGDAVDNIPGIEGCGKDRAAQLIRRFGTYKNVLKHANEVHWPKVRANLKRNAADAHLSYKLVTLRKNVPLDIDLQSLTMPRPMVSHLKELLKAFEATMQMTAIFNLDPQLARPVEKLENPFEWWEEELLAKGQPIPDLPQCGYYQRKLIQSGPYVPACIWRECQLDIETAEPTGRDVLLCEVNGLRKDPHSEWMRVVAQPISEKEYRFKVADIAHARRYRPGDPLANPERPIDIKKMPARHAPTPRKERIK